MKSMSYAQSAVPSAARPNESIPPRARPEPTRALARSSRSFFLRPADSPLRLALRVAAAVAFVTLGQMKFFDSILLGTDAVVLPDGPTGFAQYLAAIGVPFPLLSAYMVCLVEMLCGVGLVLSAFLPAPGILTRLTALPLFVDMAVATVTVGIPNLLGHPVMLDGVAVTNQIWRLPLEAGLLAAMIYLLVRPLPRRREPELVSVSSVDPAIT
jgi:putative oxidoreductase